MMRAALRQDLIREEGFRAHVYADSAGYWTIGIGRMVDKQLGGGITEIEAQMLLDNDLDRGDADLDRAMPWWRTQPENVQRALAQMCFQLGIGRLQGFKKMLAALESGAYRVAKIEGLDSAWARQTPERAKRVTDLFLIHLPTTQGDMS